MGNNLPTQINQKRFTRLFMDTTGKSAGMRFCFLLGAGASRSSGIPTGQELAKGWYQQILDDLDTQEMNDWKAAIRSPEGDFSPDYHHIIKKRFQYEPESASQELLSHIQGAQPSVGYLILARIMDKTQHNFAITTNFDHLLEKAIFTATYEPPLVCRHEKLAISAQLQISLPILIKTQQDLMFNPNFISHQGHYDEGMRGTLTSIMESFRLVVIGSSGNDECFMNFLESVEPQDRQSIFWCVQDPSKINPRARDVLTHIDYIVNIAGFDELMYGLSDVCDLEEILDTTDVDKSALIVNVKQEAQVYLNKIGELEKGANTQIDIRPIPSNENVSIQNIEKDNDDAMQDLLRSDVNPIQKLSHNEGDYQRALLEEPENAKHNADYALYLEKIKKDYTSASTYFKKAIALAPSSARINGLYAYFLAKAFDSYDEAEDYYILALEQSPENTTIHILYAIFLNNIRENYIKAEVHFRSGLQVNEKNINYNPFFRDIRNDYFAADKYYRHALEAEIA